jgi:hypothetical protein
MSNNKSIYVLPAEKGKFKVLVCHIKEGIDFTNASKANQEATRMAEEYHIKPEDVHLMTIPEPVEA